MFRVLGFLITFVCAGVAPCQTLGLGPTLSGLVYDRSTRTVRQLVGVPGSGFLGPAIALHLDKAWPSPGGERVVALRGETSSILDGVRSGAFQAELQTGLRGVSSAAWSANGSRVVLYSELASEVQTVHFAPGGPLIPAPQAADCPGVVRSVAISNEGVSVFSTTEATCLKYPGAASVELLREPGLSAAFRDDRHLLVSVNGGIRDVSLLPEQPGITEISSMQPDFLYWSGKGSRILAGKGNTVWSLDLNGDVQASVNLDRPLSNFDVLKQDQLLLINSPESRLLPGIVLDISSSNPAVYFVAVLDQAVL